MFLCQTKKKCIRDPTTSQKAVSESSSTETSNSDSDYIAETTHTQANALPATNEQYASSLMITPHYQVNATDIQ